MIHAALIPLLVACSAATCLADTQVLREVRFEPPAFAEGALPKLPWLTRADGGPAESLVVDSGVEAFGHVLRVARPDGSNENLVVRFPSRRTGTLVVSFDVWTDVPVRSLTLLVAPTDAQEDNVFSLATAYVTWDGASNWIRHFHERWIDVAAYVPGRWHHVDVLVHLSGSAAGTLDVNIDGGPFEVVQLPWRNALPTDGSLSFGQLWIIGQQRPARRPSGETWLDNLVISHIR